MKKIYIIMAFCIAAMLTGCENQKDKVSETIQVETKEIQKQAGIDVFGEVKVEIIKEIIIDFPAIIEKVHVKDGQKIKKGDEIVTLNFDEYQTDIHKKQNEVASYEQELKYRRQNINPLSSEVSRLKKEIEVKQNYLNGEDPDIKALERSLEIINSNLEIAQKDYQASKDIFEIGGLSQKELDAAKQSLMSKEKEKKDTLAAIEKAKTTRELEVNLLSASLENSEAQLTNTDRQNEINILDLESKLKAARMDLQTMENKLKKSYIKDKMVIAEADNMIAYELTYNEGARLGKGDVPLLKLMDENTLFISVDIPEEFISNVQVGSLAEVTPYADKTKSISGKVVRIADRGIKQNGETIVKADIVIDGEKGILKPGLTVDVTIYK